MAKHKKKPKRRHVTYNRKEFLAPNSITSMSAIHTKIYEDGTAIIRISDCHGSIRIWNDLNDKGGIDEMLIKIGTLLKTLAAFNKEVAVKDQTLLQL